MIDTFRFFLSQSPLLWVSMCFTFLLLGLWYARVSWYRFVGRLKIALEEQRLLLEERTQIEAAVVVASETTSSTPEVHPADAELLTPESVTPESDGGGTIPTKSASAPFDLHLESTETQAH